MLPAVRAYSNEKLTKKLTHEKSLHILNIKLEFLSNANEKQKKIQKRNVKSFGNILPKIIKPGVLTI